VALQADPATVLGLSAVLMLPVSLLSGILFTLMGATLHAEIESDTRAAGWLTLANTLGGSLGSALGGFVLLPLIGMEGSFWILCAGYASVALLARSAPTEGAKLQRPGTWAAIAFVFAIAFFPFGKMEGVYLHLSIDRWNPNGSSEIVAVREGRTETSVLLRDAIDGEVVNHRLLTDGYAMSATTSFARRYQKLYVYWPMALHAGLEEALLISYGVGNTAKALVDSDTFTHIDVVDISREILGLSDIIFPDPSERPLLDPRVSVHIEDGRFFLQTTDRRYDLITGEPPPPKNAGVVNLYTREYFQLIYDRLEEGGITTYWLPVHNTLPSDTRSIIRAFCDVFVECSLWSGQDLDWMLVGYRGRTPTPTEESMARLWRDPALQSELQAVALELPEQLGTLFMADAEQLRELVGDAPPLTDDRPKRLSNRRHSPVLARQAYRDWMDPQRNRERFRASAFVARAWPPELRERTFPYFEVEALIQSICAAERVEFAERLRDVHRVLTQTPLVTAAQWRLGAASERLRAIDALIARGGPEDPYREILARRAVARRDFGAAAALLDHAAAPLDWRSLYFRWYVLEMAGRHADARELALAHRKQMQAEREGRAVWVFMENTFGPID
jgi:spermidine synthase